MLNETDPAASGVTVVILTHNEERNIGQALASVAGWADDIYVLDSFSSDNTVEIAQKYHAHIFQNRFVNFSLQRNHALALLPNATKWVMFLDADEWLSDALKAEIREKVARDPDEKGFYINRKLIWMGTWIRRGYFPSWQLRLFRHGFGKCEERSVNEHFVIDGNTGFLENTFSDENHNGVHRWILKHNDYAEREAGELSNPSAVSENVTGRFFGSQIERRRWIRLHIWNKMPCGVRPIIYFLYRYIFLLGFLDGKMAFYFHFLQALWYPLLIDLKFLEAKIKDGRNV